MEKNIREFCGKPIIAYSIETARQSKLFDRIIVSTDSHSIGSIAAKYGASYYNRDPSNADDEATMFDAVAEVLMAYGVYEYICVLYACAPFVTPARLAEGLDILKRGEYHSVFPVWKGPHVEQALWMDGDRIRYVAPREARHNSNRWPDSYYHASQWFWLRGDMLMINETLIPEHSFGVVLPWLEVQDIDTEEDWAIAERKYQLVAK